MSKILTAREIACEALGAIAAWPVTESAPDGEKVRKALTWLDLLMADLVGTERVFGRAEPATLSMPITNGTQSYDLNDALGGDLPDDRIQYVIGAWLEDGNGNRSEIEIVTKQTFESVSKPTDTGVPTTIHIDRLNSPTLRIYPTPAASDTTAWALKLSVQKFAPNVAPAGITGTNLTNSNVHAFGQAWQRYLILQLAHDLGSGPIHKIAETSLNRFAGMAVESKRRLLAFENREHETTPPLCDAWGME